MFGGRSDSLRPRYMTSDVESCAGCDHRGALCVDRVDDLGRVDPLQVGAGDAEVCVSEPALDFIDGATCGPCLVTSCRRLRAFADDSRRTSFRLR
jgi:hypothetical protein